MFLKEYMGEKWQKDIEKLAFVILRNRKMFNIINKVIYDRNKGAIRNSNVHALFDS
jgi:hypothetical protein